MGDQHGHGDAGRCHDPGHVHARDHSKIQCAEPDHVGDSSDRRGNLARVQLGRDGDAVRNSNRRRNGWNNDWYCYFEPTKLGQIASFEVALFWFTFRNPALFGFAVIRRELQTEKSLARNQSVIIVSMADVPRILNQTVRIRGKFGTFGTFGQIRRQD